MAWTCYYCTYEQEGASSLCELCGMPGNTSSSKSTKSTKSTATSTKSTATTMTRTTTNTDNTSQNTTTQRRHRTGGTQRGVGSERGPAAATVIDLTAPQPTLGTRAGECLSRKRKGVPSKSSTTSSSSSSSSSSSRRLGRSTEANTDASASTGAESKPKTKPRLNTRERVTKAAADPVVTATRRMSLSACTMVQSTPIPILILIFQYLDQPGLMKASTISKQWHWIIRTNPGMAQHRIIPVLEIRASKNKSDEGRTIRLLEWLGANLNKVQRYRVLQLLDVDKFNGSRWGKFNGRFERLARFQLDGIVSFDVSSPFKLSSVNCCVLHRLSSRLPNLREINLSNNGGKDLNSVLGRFAFHCPQLERITWNNIDTDCNMHSNGWYIANIANQATNLREIMMDGSDFTVTASIDEISDLKNHPRFFLFCRLESQVLERISIRRAKFSTNSYVDGPQILTTVPQNALIKYIRNAPPSLRWFRSDLSKDNIEMLRLERPGIEFLN